MPLKKNIPYFLNETESVLRAKPNIKEDAVNHLILGDYVAFLGENFRDWVKVRSRRTTGWLKSSSLTPKRMLEVNYVDIGQGDGTHIVTPKDEIILIDAGEGIGFLGDGGDNMARFLNWRYNLRSRNVKGVDGVKATDQKVKPPKDIDYAIISHPDLDHYYGFYTVFQNKKFKVKKLCHNGIAERSTKGIDKKTWMYDLGRKIPKQSRKDSEFLWDVVRTNKEMHDLVDANKKTRKMYLQTLVEAKENNKKISYQFLSQSDKYLDHYKGQNPLHIQILAPITEEKKFEGKTKDCLIKFGDEGKTKNGHSIVFMLKYGKLKMLLGGDLNRLSMDYLGQHYSNDKTKMSDLEKRIQKSHEKLKDSLTLSERKKLQQQLDEDQKHLELIIARVRKVFQCDIAKACHHGASDILDSFLRTINPLATVISSGDNESHSHPRPDALGAFGKTSRGSRPLLFSTELARSTTEFSYPIKFYSVLKKLEKRMNEVTTKKLKNHYKLRMEKLRDSNVAKYGMITVRTDGERVIIAQKLEKERSKSQKWDLYELTWNSKLEEFEYVPN